MVSIADIDAEERVDDSLEEIMKLKFSLKSYLKISKLNFEIWSISRSWSLVQILKLNFDQLVVWLKSSYFVESTQPVGPLCLW